MKTNAGIWGATLGAILAYASAVLFAFPPALYFFPRLNVWTFHPQPGEPAVTWFGKVLFMIGGGVLGTAIGRMIARRPPWWILSLTAFAVLVLLAWHECRWFSG